MKSYLVLGLLVLGIAILWIADTLGFNSKSPRGILLLVLLDLAALKAFLLFQLLKGGGE